MKKLLLWLVMVVVMLAVLLGGAGYAMYAMTGDVYKRQLRCMPTPKMAAMS